MVMWLLAIRIHVLAQPASSRQRRPWRNPPLDRAASAPSLPPPSGRGGQGGHDPVLTLLGRSAAGRQAALLFGVSAALALVVAPLPWGPTGPLLVIAGVDAVVALVCLLLPWERLPSWASLAVVVPTALVMAAYAEWQIETGVGVLAFLAMLFTWIGLHHRPGTSLAVSPLAGLATVGPLVATGADAALISSAVGAIVILAVVGELVSRLVDGLRAANRSLQATDVWRAGLMATLAHDVRGPLHTIASTIDLIDHRRGQLDDAALTQILEAARRHAQRLTRLSTELLDADRIRHGQLRLELQPVDLASAIDRALKLAGLPDVSVDVEEDLTVAADPGRLEQVLVNLLTNAGRHGAPPVHITARRDDGCVQIIVRDHGDGLPDPPDRGAFGRYATAGHHPAAIGLGLWLCQTLAEAHGGSLTYQPADPGAAFTITIPADAST